MAIWVNQDTRLVVQGITGTEGKFHALGCREYGTQVVAGVTPGKGGQSVEGIPVFDSVEEARGKIRVSLEKLEPNEGVIVFTDMFGGTPSNICLSFFEKDRIEVITGVNLPMVIKFGSSRENGLGLNEMAKAIQERGARSIRVASEILADSPGGS